jgi:hypothetical protein
MNPLEKETAARALHAKAREYRGSFLNSLACIESKLDHWLTDYFSASSIGKRKLLFEEIITKIQIGRKKKILLKIIQTDYPIYWKEHETILRELQNIIDFRNGLAHSLLDVSDSALARPASEGIGFSDWKNGLPITDREFDEWRVKANMIYSCLGDLDVLLPWKQVQSDDSL